MDVFSEIEIEVIVEEAYVPEPTQEAFTTSDVAAIETELGTLVELSRGLQGNQTFEPEWLESTSEIERVIDFSSGEWFGNDVSTNMEGVNRSSANWLSAFVQSDMTDVIVADDLSELQTLEKETATYSEEIDEVVTTGVINRDLTVADFLNFLEFMYRSLLESSSGPGDVPDRWKMKPPETPTDGVQVDRDGLTIPENQDTDEQEATEDLIALAWNATWEMDGGDPTVEWGAEYNETTRQYHVFPLPPLVG